MDPLEQALANVSEGDLKSIAVGIAGAMRNDSWENDVTGFGTNRDKTTFTAFGGVIRLTDVEVTNLYHGDDLAQRMVDIVPDEMLREGFEVDVGDPNENLALADALEALDSRRKFANAIKWGRLFGGSGLLIGADDGRSAAAPLVPERAKGVSYLYELDKRYLWPLTWYDEPGHPKLGYPETYLVSPTGAITAGAMTVVHETRLILFGGAPTGIRERLFNFGWDFSVLQRAFDALRGFNTGLKAVEILLTDGSQAIFKLRGLSQFLGANGQDEARKRLMFLDLCRSVLRAIAVDAGTKDQPSEDFTRQTIPFGSIPEVLDRFILRLAAAVQIPVTILMGQSPAGMNATGESDFRWFYDRIRAQQTLELAPRIRRLVSVMRRTKAGSPNSSSVVKIKFPALWKEAPSVEAQRRLNIANADVAYINAQVLTPSEVALSRFGQGGQFGEDIVLTDDAKKIREGQVLDDLQEPPAPPDEQGDGNGLPPTDDPALTRTYVADVIDTFRHSTRVIVAGGPRTGKTILSARASERHQMPLRHSDALVGNRQWSDASSDVSKWFDDSGPWIVEGVAASRALRKWLADNPGKKLDAAVIHLQRPMMVRSAGQVAMAKGEAKVWREIKPELEARGVQIVERDS